MIDLADHLKVASLPEKTVPVCLQGDLLATLFEAQELLEQAVVRATEDQAARLGLAQDAAEAEAILDRAAFAARFTAEREAVEAAQAAVKAAQLPFRLRALPPHRWTSLMVEHPPRPGNEQDERTGVNQDTFSTALVRASLRDPQPTDEQWAELVGPPEGVLHISQLEALIDAATALSRRKVNLVPFSPGAFAPTEPSALS